MFTDKQTEEMREYLAHEDEYMCIYLSAQVAKKINDPEEALKVLSKIRSISSTPAEKRENLSKFLKDELSLDE